MPLSYHTASVWPTGRCPWMLTVTLWSFLLICISYWYTVKEGIQDDKFQNYCLEPPIFNPFGRHQEAFSYLLTLDLPSSCTDPFWREGFLIVSHPLGVEMPEKPEDLPWRNHLSLSIWGGQGDSLPGLEDLLHPQLTTEPVTPGQAFSAVKCIFVEFFKHLSKSINISKACLKSHWKQINV